MKHFRFPALVLVLMLGTLALLACAAPAVQAPAVATTAPATTAPTSAPTTIPPTTAPTNTATAAAADEPADEIVSAAFAKLSEAESFRLQAHTELSPVFFQGQYTPLPGEDPDMVNLFAIDGEQAGSDMQYALNGFLASFIAVFTGFDPNTNEIEIAQVDGTRYMRGPLENETEAKWYILPDDPNLSFAPRDMVQPMTSATYPDESFTKTGTATVGSQTCDVYTGNRAAFDVVFPGLGSAALLNEETLDLESIDETEFTVTVCPDGFAHRIVYNFAAHSKTDEDEKGTFTFETQITDYDADITITAPEGAVAMPASPFGATTPEAQATPTTAVTTAFTTLEGEWEGLIDGDTPISFTVEDGAVTYANINYAISEGGCSTSGVIANSVDNGEIDNSQFIAVMTDSDNVEYTLQGEFESNNAASGTLNIKGETFCGDTDADFAWTAQHISSPDVVETPAATAEPTTAPTLAPITPTPTRTATTRPTVQPTRTATTAPTAVPPTAAPTSSVDGVKLITDAFAAFAARDLNGTLANVSDNVAFNLAGTTGVGKAALQSNMQLALTFGAGFSVSDVRQTGNIVNFTTTVTGIRPGVYPNSSATIENGQITVLNLN